MFFDPAIPGCVVGCLRREEGARGYVIGEELGIDCVEDGGKKRGEERFEGCDERAVGCGVEGEEGVQVVYSAWEVG